MDSLIQRTFARLSADQKRSVLLTAIALLRENSHYLTEEERRLLDLGDVG